MTPILPQTPINLPKVTATWK